MDQINLNLFGEPIPTPQPKTSVVIVGKGKQVLSKEQLRFNRLTKQVAKLRAENPEIRQAFEDGLAAYQCEVGPLEVCIAGLREQTLTLMFPFFAEQSILKPDDRDVLRTLLDDLLYEVLKTKKAGPEHKHIFETLHGLSYDQAVEEDMEVSKRDLEDMFASNGINADFSDIDLSDPEQLARKMAELKNAVNEPKAQSTTRRMTDKQKQKLAEAEALEKEKEKARQRSLSTIYRQLAKALHPDLEQDEMLKLEKEALMKQLTVAYEANDLHGLLLLEAQWAHQNNDNLQALSDEKLAIYNAVLKEQVEQLQDECFYIFNDPRFEVLDKIHGTSKGKPYFTIDKEVGACEQRIQSFENSISELKGKNALKEVRYCVKLRKDVMKEQWYYPTDAY